MIAAASGQWTTVKCLLENSDPDALDAFGCDALVHACSARSDGCFELILGHRQALKIDRVGRNALCSAAKHGHLHAVVRLLGMGQDPHLRDHGGCSAWMLAALNGHKDCVEALLPHVGMDSVRDVVQSDAGLSDLCGNGPMARIIEEWLRSKTEALELAEAVPHTDGTRAAGRL